MKAVTADSRGDDGALGNNPLTSRSAMNQELLVGMTGLNFVALTIPFSQMNNSRDSL